MLAQFLARAREYFPGMQPWSWVTYDGGGNAICCALGRLMLTWQSIVLSGATFGGVKLRPLPLAFDGFPDRWTAGEFLVALVNACGGRTTLAAATSKAAQVIEMNDNTETPEVAFYTLKEWLEAVCGTSVNEPVPSYGVYPPLRTQCPAATVPPVRHDARTVHLTVTAIAVL